STKGATGHCFGAAGAVEAVFTVLAVERGVLPPTINYEQQDPECDLDYIPNESRQADVTVGVSNSFGFGGHKACIVVRKFEAEQVSASACWDSPLEGQSVGTVPITVSRCAAA